MADQTMTPGELLQAPVPEGIDQETWEQYRTTLIEGVLARSKEAEARDDHVGVMKALNSVTLTASDYCLLRNQTAAKARQGGAIGLSGGGTFTAENGVKVNVPTPARGFGGFLSR